MAIKFIPVEDCDDAARWSEVAALKRLHHPHVVRLYDVIRGEDSVLLVLECLTGGETQEKGRVWARNCVPGFASLLHIVWAKLWPLTFFFSPLNPST